MKWFTVPCVRCGEKVMIPDVVAVRVADGESFVMCDPCGDAHALMYPDRIVHDDEHVTVHQLGA